MLKLAPYVCGNSSPNHKSDMIVLIDGSKKVSARQQVFATKQPAAWGTFLFSALPLFYGRLVPGWGGGPLGWGRWRRLLAQLVPVPLPHRRRSPAGPRPVHGRLYTGWGSSTRAPGIPGVPRFPRVPGLPPGVPRLSPRVTQRLCSWVPQHLPASGQARLNLDRAVETRLGSVRDCWGPWRRGLLLALHLCGAHIPRHALS